MYNACQEETSTVLETLTDTDKTKGLLLLQEDPGFLVPQRLLELVANPAMVRAIPLKVWLGRLNQEYQPDLSILIVEQNRLTPKGQIQSVEDGWIRVLNNRRNLAINQGLITSKDRALISLVAHRFYPDGIQVESYVEAPDLRRKGLGVAFYSLFEEILEELGYKFVCGINNHTNLLFFLKMGRYAGSQLTEQAKEKYFYNLFRHTAGVPTIRFFDRQLEKECVIENLLPF